MPEVLAVQFTKSDEEEIAPTFEIITCFGTKVFSLKAYPFTVVWGETCTFLSVKDEIEVGIAS